jgi:hypothetical protein
LLVGAPPLVLLVEQAERDFLEGVGQAGESPPRRLVVDEQVDMVFLSVEFVPVAAEASAWVSEPDSTFAV